MTRAATQHSALTHNPHVQPAANGNQTREEQRGGRGIDMSNLFSVDKETSNDVAGVLFDEPAVGCLGPTAVSGVLTSFGSSGAADCGPHPSTISRLAWGCCFIIGTEGAGCALDSMPITRVFGPPAADLLLRRLANNTRMKNKNSRSPPATQQKVRWVITPSWASQTVAASRPANPVSGPSISIGSTGVPTVTASRAWHCRPGTMDEVRLYGLEPILPVASIPRKSDSDLKSSG
ncbi:hypothetical protein BP6252_01785 [Coleophoma cylindrospora]|uniref:Uncharacterized protein n=1 Tax=Coleophoma cylindrospora TaxID=1849047 RepID=A0A3D8STW2_9HELO|nr:hypothetical protein BP6252_01785 [Coleophoma cylindrospora]